MQQICYASKATFNQSEILTDLRDILTEARHFNHLNKISGVLFYADGYFFQCVEGEADVIQQLMHKLKKDKRHHSVHVFEIKKMNQTLFSEWSMKFVGRNSQIQHYLNGIGQRSFNPMLFNQYDVDRLLQHLQIAHAQEINT